MTETGQAAGPDPVDASAALTERRVGMGGGSEPELPQSTVLRQFLATLDPGYFAWVMATGIVSIGASLLGYAGLSQVLLGVTVFAFGLLLVCYGARAVWFTDQMRRSLRDPTTAMAYFTVVAGTDVLATRTVMAGHPGIALALGSAAAVVWLALTYGLPWSIVAGAHRPVLAEINGTWLIWVVSTQSLSIVASAVSAHSRSDWMQSDLPAIAACLWGLGVMLYMILIAIIFLRLLLIAVTPAEMGPAYWIAMGATAISVRAAAGILDLKDHHSAAMVSELRPFLTGFSLVLWAFGTWWIPLLILLGIWRYILRHYPRSYEPRLWSVVFPLGMYTVASWTLGHAGAFGFMNTVARVWVWVGVGAWTAATVLMAGALLRAVGRPPEVRT